jgi:hypothetical protein
MTRTKPKGHQAHKRGAEEDSTSSRRSKRRAAGDGSESTASVQSVATLSAEEQFKLKNAAEFDDAEQVKEKHVEIKDEPAGDSNPQPPSTAGPSTTAKHHVRSPSVHTPARNVFGDQTTQVADRENVLDTLLSQDFNTEMTRHAVQQILQDARESAGSDNELGVAYVEARIFRLQQMGIPSSRLSEVVHLFQSSLRGLLDQLSSRIESIGEVSTPRTTISAGTRRQAPDQGKHLRVDNHRSVKRTHGDTSRAGAAQKPAAKNRHTQLAAFEAAHSHSDSSDSSSSDDQGDDDKADRTRSKLSNSRYLANDDDDYMEDTNADRSDFTEEEKSMLIVSSVCSLCLCLLTLSDRSGHIQSERQSPTLRLSAAKSFIRRLCPLRDLRMHGRTWRREYCHGHP